jgi:diaminopimelate epimerase
MKLTFVKASGAGNDFVVVDYRRNDIPSDRSTLARTLCHRHLGIGADGVLYIEPSSKAHFRMNYYNADGSAGGMCGNGGRCSARYAALTGLAPSTMKFEALDFLYDAVVGDNTVRLHMKNPAQFRPVEQLKVLDKTINGYFINTGSPHFVTCVDELEDLDVHGLGRALRVHEAFSPEGTNVNFIVRSRTGLVQRTYERGVEAETLACGTGSVASAIVHALSEGMASPVEVRVRSGELLKIYFDRTGERIENVWLEGSANMVFEGTADISETLDSISVAIAMIDKGIA